MFFFYLKQDMQRNVYSTQEACEKKVNSNDKEGCSVNKEIIDKITQNDEKFCQLCTSSKLESDINMCQALSKIWQTLYLAR